MSEETWGVEAPEQRCDSCDAAPPVRFSPDHCAHFCPSCFTRENPPSSPLPAEGETERMCGCIERDDPTGEYDEGCAHNEPASAAAGEVRVEWGVRAVGKDQRTYKCDDEDEARHWVRDQQQVPDVPQAEIVSRTVTTSPWVPVSDDQPKEA